MHPPLEDIVDLELYPLQNDDFRSRCKLTLNENGVLVMRDFLKPAAIASVQSEGIRNQHLAYYAANKHNIYLTPPDPGYPADHPRNREVSSSKGCITTDQIPADSALRSLYDALGSR